MLTPEQNDYLTRIGPGTPAGKLLRRYWHPIAPAQELTDERPKKRVRVLGEDLVLYRTDDGGYGLIAEHCAHRAASMYYGFIEGRDIRCAYHGWRYDQTGQCLEQPFEQENRRFKERVKMTAYPVQRYRGLVFPNMLRVPEGPRQSLHWRVPIDDTHTMIFRAGVVPNKNGTREDINEDPEIDYMDGIMTPDGSEYAMDTFMSQDAMAWETQGAIFDRTKEHLGAEDKGIAMYRRLLKEQIDLVQAGGSPMALVWDPDQQEVDFDVSTGQARPEFITRSYD